MFFKSESLLQQAMSPENINLAWKRLKKEHTPWSVTVSREQMQANIAKYLLACRDEVLSGEYKPQPLRQYAMKKPSGKVRIISAYYLKDKLIQRALLNLLQPRLEKQLHDDCYAYRPGRGIDTAIKKVNERIRIGLHWLVDADIFQFFDQINIRLLRKKLKSFVNHAETMKLLNLWLEQGVHFNSFLSIQRGISQGSVLSPFFCNLYMMEFDNALDRANIPFVRYADDFLLFAQDQQQAEQARFFAQQQLSRLGLCFNEEKTQIVQSSREVIFLGYPLLSYKG